MDEHFGAIKAVAYDVVAGICAMADCGIEEIRKRALERLIANTEKLGKLLRDGEPAKNLEERWELPDNSKTITALVLASEPTDPIYVAAREAFVHGVDAMAGGRVNIDDEAYYRSIELQSARACNARSVQRQPRSNSITLATEKKALEAARLLAGLRDEIANGDTSDRSNYLVNLEVSFRDIIDLLVDLEQDIGELEINRLRMAKPLGSRIVIRDLLEGLQAACGVVGEASALVQRGEVDAAVERLGSLPEFVCNSTTEDELIWELGAIEGRSQSVKAIEDNEPKDDRKPTYDLQDDGLSLVCGDRVYNQTSSQAAIVKILFEAWKAGRPTVPQDSIREAVYLSIDGGPTELRDVFRESSATGRKGRERYAAVWREAIVRGERRNTLRLKDPEK